MDRPITAFRLVLLGLRHYWRTHLAVLVGVATAVAVLTGALLVGDSVRGSLRDLVLQRLGRTDQVVVSPGFFREALGTALGDDVDFRRRFRAVVPVALAQGGVSVQGSDRRASRVDVYGVDDRFWTFHAIEGIEGPAGRGAFISPVLADDLGVTSGDTILVRIRRPSDVPLESLFGRKDDVGRTLRLTVQRVIPRESLGEFSLQPSQGASRALFVPLDRLQQDLEVGARVNALLVSDVASDPGHDDDADGTPVDALETMVRRQAELADLGLRVRRLDDLGVVALEADAGILDDARLAAVTEAAEALDGVTVRPVFTYLANRLRAGGREVPYSLVTAIDLSTVVPDPNAIGERTADDERPPIVLNEWAARELGASPGDPLVLDYYVWVEPGQLLPRSAEFSVAAVVPVEAGDRDLAPPYPGITEATTLSDWDPPFPIDLRRVRPVDEDYWNRYRTTPKAFVPLEVGQRLWRSRYGSATSVRLRPGPQEPLAEVEAELSEPLGQALDPLAFGLVVRDVRREGLDASRGATDFGEYFVYFSFFLVISALVLAALFFRLSVEQRARELGLLRAVGFGPGAVRRLFVGEGACLALVGAAAGLLGGLGYASLLMAALRTWWLDAVGTTDLTLHVTLTSLVSGGGGGVLVAIGCIWWTVRGLGRLSDRSLLAGQLSGDGDGFGAGGGRAKTRRYLLAAVTLLALGLLLMGGSLAGAIGSTGGFFGAGAALLAGCLCVLAVVLRTRFRGVLDADRLLPVIRLGARNATFRPGRSLLAMTVVASATFILISVDAFRREGGPVVADRQSGQGGYALIVESLLPIAHDLSAPEGRDALGIDVDDSIRIESLRVRPGEDASCLNLYAPTNPRIMAVPESFIAEDRFAFAASLAEAEAEADNPWRLLTQEQPDGAVPVIADANSMTYVLHRGLGDTIDVPYGDGTLSLRLVAALRDSIFQGELLMSEANFLRLFPAQEGFQALLVETPADQVDAVRTELAETFVDFGATVTSTGARLAEFHRVENTYLSTFQMLGGLGLLLGTLGLAAVLLRNVLERRKELALLRALGYRPSHFLLMVVSENLFLLVGGLVSGALCALVAVAPALAQRGQGIPVPALAVLVGGVLVVGLMASLGATAAALRAPLLASLRSE